MKQKIKINKYVRIISLLIITTLFIPFIRDSHSAISNITVTPAAPTNMSTGLGYYLAGSIVYTFQIRVEDPAATAWADINYVDLTVPTDGTDITIRADTFVAGPSCTGSVTAGTAEISSVTVTGTYNDFTVSYGVKFIWTSVNSAWASRNIRADASITSVSFNQTTLSYGISSQIRINNFALSAEAANGRINPWHNTFTVTGAVVYDIPGTSNDDKVYFANSGAELTEVRLLINSTLDTSTTATTTTIPVDTAFTNDNADDISFTVPEAYLNDLIYTNSDFALGDRPLAMRAYFTSTGGPLISTNTKPLNIDEVEVTDIVFSNGGGIDNDPGGYYRSVNVPGTQVTITARMRGGGTAMDGDTTIELRDLTDSTITTIVIPHNTTTATTNLTYAGLSVGAGTTAPRNYEIYNVYNGAHGSAATFGQYRNSAAYIPSQPATHTIYWENNDPPGANTPPFTADLGAVASAQTIQFNWTPVTDGDFYSYRIYYRESGGGSYTMIDRNTVAASPVQPFSDLGILTTGSFTISGLIPLTDYEYVISAVDVFGNEVIDANRTPGDPASAPGTISTGAAGTTMTISDGITKYVDTDFNGDPAPNPNLILRDTSIKVDATIITTGNSPDTVSIIIANNNTEPTNITDAALIEGTDKWTIQCSKSGRNTYTAFIPSNHPLIQSGTEVRMIMKVTYGAGTNYMDHDIDFDPAEQLAPDPHDNEWRFYIGTPTTFKPWPTRILNNVITRSNPTAYPAYYLTKDARVTMKIYDIKGRVVATLLDNAFRKGGQNIKDQGWSGINKAGRKVGPGLYFIHIKAVAGSSDKVIINKIKKIMVAR